MFHTQNKPLLFFMKCQSHLEGQTRGYCFFIYRSPFPKSAREKILRQVLYVSASQLLGYLSGHYEFGSYLGTFLFQYMFCPKVPLQKVGYVKSFRVFNFKQYFSINLCILWDLFCYFHSSLFTLPSRMLYIDTTIFTTEP